MNRQGLLVGFGAIGAFFAAKYVSGYAVSGLRYVLGKLVGGEEVGFYPRMTRSEALKILGLSTQTPTREQVETAHRKLAYLNHPDKGGSQLIASKVNEAKELLNSGKSSLED